MKNATIWLFLLIAGCAADRQLSPEELTIKTEISVPGLSARQIFDKSKVWIVRNLYSKEDIIAMEDRDAGVIVANGYIDYPAAGALESVEKIQYTISFVMKEDIRDSGIIITFSGLELNIPKNYRRSRFRPMQEYTGGYSLPLTRTSDYQAARKGLLDIVRRLRENLTEKE